MVQRQAQTIAYPAESMLQPTAPEVETVATMELTPVEAMHSVWAGIGIFLAVFAVRCLLAGQWSVAYAISALLWGLFVCGCLLIVRYVFDLGAILKNQYSTMRKMRKAHAEEMADIQGDLGMVLFECEHLRQAHANEMNRAQHAEAQLELARKQPRTQQPSPKFTPYDGPPVSEMPDNYAPYADHPLTLDEELRAGVDVEPEEEDIDLWAAAILRNYEDHGHIARERTDGTGVIKAQGITQGQYIKARDLLIELGIVGGNQHAGYGVLDVDYDTIMDTYLASKY